MHLHTGQSCLSRKLRLGASVAIAAVLCGCGPDTGVNAGGANLSEDAKNAVVVTSQDEFSQAVRAVKPGGTIVLANGEWDNFEILFEGQGTAEAPITLTAETLGRVVLTGQSNLRLAGEHLIVDGLVFRDGYTPTSSVISFRRDDEALANHSAVRNTVIDGFSNPERFETDSWVQIFGRNNRFESNHLSGKGNQGVTLAVRLNTEESRENDHIIANNYFGPRPVLGSNGGETLRIGTSHYSLSDSRTVLENNVFDRTNGELEIVSVKSGRNILRSNTFLAARGTLTLRHGNNNVIERNVFLGENADHTGGIRVINGGQQVRENYMEALTGIRFGGAFTVMNGVPNSPINRYHPVADARIEMNSIIGSDRIQLGAGSDSERSAVPTGSTFHSNLVARDVTGPVFEVYDDMSGIDFADNVLVGPGDAVFDTGFVRSDATLSRAENGLFYPPVGVTAGAPRDLAVTSMTDVGVSWYPKAPAEIAFGSGARIQVGLEDGALFAVAMASNAGDVLVLAPGDHMARKTIKLSHPVTIEGASAATISFERSALFQIENGGSLRLDGVTITGRSAPDMVGNSVIRTSPYSMTQNYRLEIVDSEFVDLDINRFFDVVRGAKSTLADHIQMDGTRVSNISGSVFNFDDEVDNFGRYNAEYITVKNSEFTDIQGPFATLYRGGRDESTFGPHFEMRGSSFTNVGLGTRNARGVSLWLHGVQDTDMVDNIFTDSAPISIDHTVGDPQTDIVNNVFENTAGPKVIEITSGLAPTARLSNNKGL